MNTITVYQGNTKEITCTVEGLTDLSGYQGKLTVKRDARDENPLFEITGTINALNIDFEVTAENNSLNAGEYIYEVWITNGTKTYTVVQDIYEVEKSVKYQA